MLRSLTKLGLSAVGAFCPVAIPDNDKMIRCHLSTLMGRHKLKIADVARETGLNRSTVTALYRESASRIDVDAVNKLCRLFGCAVGDLFEFIDGEQPVIGRLRDTMR